MQSWLAFRNEEVDSGSIVDEQFRKAILPLADGVTQQSFAGGDTGDIERLTTREKQADHVAVTPCDRLIECVPSGIAIVSEHFDDRPFLRECC